MDEVLQYDATWCIPLAATSAGQLRLFIPAITAGHVGLKTTCAPVDTTDQRYAWEGTLLAAENFPLSTVGTGEIRTEG
jgi:hypothetical protein